MTPQQCAYTEIENCRICGSPDLGKLLTLGEQHLTGVFPKTPRAAITRGPLDLVLCRKCGLLQLKQSYHPPEMYGANYGYRSGLNRSMVEHLGQKVARLEKLCRLQARDLVLDIGSNDGTLLKSYKTSGLVRVGMDPTGTIFKEYYPQDVTLIPDFYSAGQFLRVTKGAKAKLITSIAMFYDLESPVSFIEQVTESLTDDGIWHFEQSYMPAMLEATAYDTICHEHLEYYGLTQIKWLTDRANLKIVDVVLSDVNGGSFAVTVCKEGAGYSGNQELRNALLGEEKRKKLSTVAGYEKFARKVVAHRDSLVNLVRSLNQQGKRVIGYGASTKGNVLLQYCGFSPADIPYIAEVNERKFGSYTPGTGIPIISEKEARAMKPDYFLVLPWHFRDNIIQREASYVQQGGQLIFPLPELTIFPLSSSTTVQDNVRVGVLENVSA